MKKLFILFISLIFLSGCTQTTIDTSSTDSVTATIYMSDSQVEKLVSKQVTLDKVSYQSLFSELINNNVIPENCTIKDFSISNNVGFINFSKEFYNSNLGSSAEILMLDSIAKTYLTNLKLDKFKLLVDGREYESGHIILEKDDYFTLENISN